LYVRHPLKYKGSIPKFNHVASIPCNYFTTQFLNVNNRGLTNLYFCLSLPKGGYMVKSKRLLIATLFGLISGIVCWGLASSGGPMAWYQAVAIVLSRTLIGFTIGISLLKMKWWLHGIAIGAVVSLPGSFFGFYVPGKELFIFFSTFVMGIIYGFFIELFTTVIFKAKAL